MMHERDVTFHLMMANDDRRQFVEALARAPQLVEKALRNFDARTAEASNEEDKEKIFALIQSRFGEDGARDAFEHFNQLVNTALANALMAASWQVSPERRKRTTSERTTWSRSHSQSPASSPIAGRGSPATAGRRWGARCGLLADGSADSRGCG
jgi:hypothetical protein